MKQTSCPSTNERRREKAVPRQVAHRRLARELAETGGERGA